MTTPRPTGRGACLLVRPTLLTTVFMNNVALAILAHPDDAEFLCAGTLVRLRKEHNWKIHVATMTPGDCGSAEHSPDDIARIRRGEGKAAAEAIGGAYHCVEEPTCG